MRNNIYILFILILFIGIILPGPVSGDVTMITTTSTQDGYIVDTDSDGLGNGWNRTSGSLFAGDFNSNNEDRSFIGFDISSIPAGMVVSSATLYFGFRGDSGQVSNYAPVNIDHVDFGIAINPDDFQRLCASHWSNVAVLSGPEIISWSDDTYIDRDVTVSVISDYNNAQSPVRFRIRADHVTANGQQEFIRIYSVDNAAPYMPPYLKIHYYVKPTSRRIPPTGLVAVIDPLDYDVI